MILFKLRISKSEESNMTAMILENIEKQESNVGIYQKVRKFSENFQREI